ncbi:hypothetical protein [Candidatus Lokiarchaeum ossiferum]|uniref:hypothetical protein n=1 Tax=Candidatus Lokiarchaeum ossiferum TaxID=2951803 RepID=UPI00352E462A
MSEFLDLNSIQKETLRLLEEANSKFNFKYDVSGYTSEQREGFAKVLTPLVMADVFITKAIAILKGVNVQEVVKTKEIDMVNHRFKNSH